MNSPLSASSSFSALTTSEDAIAVLVLVETSGLMLSYWDEVKTFYLPVLLDTLRNAHNAKTMRLCWQTSQSVFAPNQASSAGDATGNEIPDFRFDPVSPSAISTAALRFSIETLKAAFHDRYATRHLIIVAASAPTDDLKKPFADPTVLHEISARLRQEKIRFHMILGASHSAQMFHQLHQQVLQPQNCRPIPLWFRTDTAKFNILLMGKPSGLSTEGVSTPSSSASVASSSSQGAGTPVSSFSSLPSSPILADPYASSDRRKSASPQTRRGKPGTLEQPAHGLVSYLQQMHGLTKKRTYGGGKAPKRASTGDTPRSSSSSSARPILPRLDLPDQRPRGFSPYPVMGSPTTERPATEKPGPSSQYSSTHLASMSTPSSPSDDGRRSRTRWPWIQPGPLPSLSSGSSSTTAGAENALRSLSMMTPRRPELAARLPDFSAGRSDTMALPAQGQAMMDMSYPAPPHTSFLSQRESADWHYRQRSSTIATSHPTDYRMSATPSPTLTAQGYDPAWAQGPYAPHTHGFPPHDHLTPIHDLPHRGFSHVSPPASISQRSSASDPEDQPFLLTPEFEALANARFEAAVRSGAMQASMTSTTLTSVPVEPVAPATSGANVVHPTAVLPPPHFPHAHHGPYDVHGQLSTVLGHPPGVVPQARFHPTSSGHIPPLPGEGPGHARHGGPEDPTQSRWFGL